jgi:hypothetical protein
VAKPYFESDHFIGADQVTRPGFGHVGLFVFPFGVVTAAAYPFNAARAAGLGLVVDLARGVWLHRVVGHSGDPPISASLGPAVWRSFCSSVRLLDDVEGCFGKAELSLVSRGRFERRSTMRFIGKIT